MNKRSAHAKKAIISRWKQEEYPGIPEYSREGNTNPNQTKPIQTKPDQSKGVGAEASEPSASAPAIPLIDGTEFRATEKEIAQWQEDYPAVEVLQELRQMRSWCSANPKLRKTKKGIRRFIVNWLSKEQDKGHPGVSVRKDSKAGHQRPDFVPTEF